MKSTMWCHGYLKKQLLMRSAVVLPHLKQPLLQKEKIFLYFKLAKIIVTTLHSKRRNGKMLSFWKLSLFVTFLVGRGWCQDFYCPL